MHHHHHLLYHPKLQVVGEAYQGSSMSWSLLTIICAHPIIHGRRSRINLV